MSKIKDMLKNEQHESDSLKDICEEIRMVMVSGVPIVKREEIDGTWWENHNFAILWKALRKAREKYANTHVVRAPSREIPVDYFVVRRFWSPVEGKGRVRVVMMRRDGESFERSVPWCRGVATLRADCADVGVSIDRLRDADGDADIEMLLDPV